MAPRTYEDAEKRVAALEAELKELKKLVKMVQAMADELVNVVDEKERKRGSKTA